MLNLLSFSGTWAFYSDENILQDRIERQFVSSAFHLVFKVKTNLDEADKLRHSSGSSLDVLMSGSMSSGYLLMR